MMVDDAWASVGSCNLHHHSLLGNNELNTGERIEAAHSEDLGPLSAELAVRAGRSLRARR
jgi:hypothetical protein